jgi:hypothetical protein
MMNTFVRGSYSPLPSLREAPRVARDIEQILAFIARQPWGDPVDRKKDIHRGIDQILAQPRRNRVCIRRRATGIELRRHTSRSSPSLMSTPRPTQNTHTEL